MPHNPPADKSVVVIMGVSGTGKSTIGAWLAERLSVPYAEADAFHPRHNIVKMASGTPLDDEDRAPWLDAIGDWAADHASDGGVVSCSALKRAYRDRLRAAAAPGALFFVHLDGDRALIADRMAARFGHFMPQALLDSQFAALEPLQGDEDGVVVGIDTDPETVVCRAVDGIRNGMQHQQSI
jgi:gluconokinase